jgi:hypothetical protein
MKSALGSILLTFVFVLTIWLAVLSRNQERHQEPDAVAGTDMFWEYHDQHFPTHYKNDRVICTEEQAIIELEKLGMNIVR